MIGNRNSSASASLPSTATATATNAKAVSLLLNQQKQYKKLPSSHSSHVAHEAHPPHVPNPSRPKSKVSLPSMASESKPFAVKSIIRIRPFLSRERTALSVESNLAQKETVKSQHLDDGSASNHVDNRSIIRCLNKQTVEVWNSRNEEELFHYK